MEKKTGTNKVLDTIAWGVFAVILGAGWIAASTYHMDTFVYIALGTGHTLVALNLARWILRIKVSKISLYAGLLVNTSTVALAVFALPFIPTATALAGLVIVAEAMQKAISRKTIQA